jgi:hypothetical protein
MDLQTAYMVPHSHPASARVRLIDPLTIDVNRGEEIWGIVDMDNVWLPVNPANAYN